MQNSGLSNLTIVIPTISRPQFVLRQFEYWKISDAQVVILDGARQPIEIPEHLKSPNIRYVCTGTRFNERLATAGNYVSTAYCALLPDDEFFLFSGLHAAVERLEAHRDLIGCVGRCLGFFVDQGRFLTRDMYRDWKPFSERATTQLARLDEDLPPQSTHIATYAIARSAAWTKVLSNSYSTFYSCAYTYERLTNLQRSLLGRTEIIEDLLWMRSLENLPISDSTTPRTNGRDLVSWARDSSLTHEVSLYRSSALELILHAGLNLNTAKYFERRFFEIGVEQQALKEARGRRSPRKRLRHFALSYTPQVLRTAAKKYVPNRALAFSGWQGFELDEMCASLIERGTRFDREDLEFVKELSLKLDAASRHAGNSTT